MVSLKNKKIISVLIVIVNIMVFLSTFYVLINPAQSQTAEDYSVCGYNEHIHTDLCYISYTDDYVGKILKCEITGKNGSISHIHDSLCYDSAGSLICPVEEYKHIHTKSCFNENNEQICGVVVHQHTEQCFCNPEDIEDKENYKLLACSQEAHTHKDECFEIHLQEEEIEPEEIHEKNIRLMYNHSPEIYSAENEIETYSLDTSGAADMSEKSENGYKYINSISVSYQSSDESWIKIGESDVKFPADADYRLEVSYKVSIGEIQTKYGGKMMLSDIPEWLNPDKDGEIMVDSVPVADMQVQDGTLLITFYDDFMEENSDKNLSGSFFVRGSVNWQKLDHNTGEIHLPTIDMTINFEDNLPQKYGKLDILKSYPELVYAEDGKPYFEYVLTVKSAETEYTIPDVKVFDKFTKNDKFIMGYSGIDGNIKTLADHENGFEPYETRTYDSAGTVVKNSEGMCWDIGDLKADEERKLTYYAEIDPYYIGSFGRGSIINTAEAFSGDIPKGADSKEFIPRAEAWINKKFINADVNDYGTGTAVYQVEITAAETNSYNLINLRLHDFVDEKFSGFVTYPDTVTAVSSDGTTQNIKTEKTDNTSFNAVIPVLRAGEKMTVTYTINLENILASGTGNIDFLNTAELFSEKNSGRGDASDRSFGSSQNSHTFSQSQWVRKLDGGNLTEDEEIPADTGKAYQFNGSGISETGLPEKFTVPSGSKKYQVILNEKGTWDLSSATMKDKFDNTGIVYRGWLCIQEFEKSGVSGLPTDTEIIKTLNGQTPSKTVWLNIDGRNDFDFVPSELGLSANYTYLMTYYAGIKDIANTGDIMITNNFEIYGTIGVGGQGFQIAGVKIGVSSVMQGNVKYNVHKDAWYYSEHPDENGKVYIFESEKYNNGAIYWVIRLDGTINAGFRIKDIVNGNGGTNHDVCADVLMGVYKGAKSLDFTSEFPSYSVMLDHVGSGKELEALSGNQLNFGFSYGWWTGINQDNIGMVYDKTNITNISDLDGRSFVIANFNGASAVVSAEINGTGLTGNQSFRHFTANVEALSDDNPLTEWHFKKISDNKYYIYTYVDGNIKYMNISDNKNVSLSDNPTELYIHQNSTYSGKIKITNENGMALNWYGGSNSSNLKFSGWNSNNPDENDFHTLFEAKDDYKWCAGADTTNVGLCFQKDMNLKDDEALYVVIRTRPSIKPSVKDYSQLYRNGVASKQNGSSTSDWVTANTTEYTLKAAPAVFKEGKTSYHFDGTNWVYSAGEANRLQYWYDKNLITESGTYAEWLINVNWDGSMEGVAEVTDQLPKGVTPVYIRPYYTVMSPTYPTIPELENDNDWISKNTSGIPFYYNPTTNEIRWRVGNLEKEVKNPLAINTKTVNLQLVCKINDPEILLSGGTESIDNTVIVENNGIVSKNVGTVPVAPECSLQKECKGMGAKQQISFEITVNPYKETLGSNGTLPPLIDEFSDNMLIVESSIEVKTADGNAVTGYTYKIENNQLIINKLPDRQKLIITYKARTTTSADKENDVKVSNMAYWSGYKAPENPQVKDFEIKYSMGGDGSLSSNPKVSILKTDSENGAKHLSGAEFALYESDGDKFIDSGITDNNGKLTFESNISYNKVYYLVETQAPAGYRISSEKHYFVVTKDNQTGNFGSNIDVWESRIFGSEYECTITNSKEKIIVNKTFSDDKNGNSVPDSAKFRFGIFDRNPEKYSGIKPLQILEIEYINGNANYKLDSIIKNAPEFTIAEPNQSYYVFEIDESGKPVSDGKYLNTGGKTYEVKYTSGFSDNNMVTVAKNQIDIENKAVYFTMPSAGGAGLGRYYLFAGLFFGIALLIALKKYNLLKKS